MGNMILEGTASIVQMLVFVIYLKDMLGFRRHFYWMPVCWGLVEVIYKGTAANYAGVDIIIYF